jgi:DivIVA domain-containing protein
MDRESIDEIRSASFTFVRKGYDPGEVRGYLGELAARLERGEPAHPGSDAVRRELELVGQKTAAILAQAEESAERMHAEAVREASGVLAKARDEAQAVRRAADEQAEAVRTEADSYADATRAEADRESVAELAAELEDLERRRDAVLAQLADLIGELDLAVSRHERRNRNAESGELSQPGEPAPAA